jgi:hypothetical protein
MSNLDLYNKVKQPPKDALKQIGAGRLKGMTDINPQWRYQALTEHLGLCGIGWKYQIIRLWMDNGTEGQVIAWAEIALYIKFESVWSDAIPGIGGSTFIAKEKSGLHTSDEAYKMAVTDALSVACKMIGIGADIYAGKWDGSKYADEKSETPNLSKQVGEKKPPLNQMLQDKVPCPEGKGENNMVSPKYCNKGCEFKAKCPTWYSSENEIPLDEIPI